MVVIKKSLTKTLIAISLFATSLQATKTAWNTPISFVDVPTNQPTIKTPSRQIPKRRSSQYKTTRKAPQNMEDFIRLMQAEQEKTRQTYEPTSLEKGLAWANKRRHDFTAATHTQQNDGMLKKIGHGVLGMGKAIFTPLSWLQTKLQPAVAQTIFKQAHNYLAQTEMLQDMPEPLIQQQAYTATQILTPLANTAVNKTSRYFANKFLSLLIDTNGLPSPKTHPGAYKNAVIRKIIARFENQLPEELQEGKAFHYYLQGKKVYGKAKLVYDLLDNVTAILSLGYELTDYAQVMDPTKSMTRIKKAITIFDIVRRCADSYLKIKANFNLGTAKRSQFEQSLSWLVSVANFICPKREGITMLWEIGKMAYQMRNVQDPKIVGPNRTQEVTVPFNFDAFLATV